MRIAATETVAINCGVGHVNTGVDRTLHDYRHAGRRGHGRRVLRVRRSSWPTGGDQDDQGRGVRAGSAERLRREARAAAKVNHPPSASSTRSARKTASCFSRWNCSRGNRSPRGSRAAHCRPGSGLDRARHACRHRGAARAGAHSPRSQAVEHLPDPHGVKLLDFGLT